MEKASAIFKHVRGVKAGKVKPAKSGKTSAKIPIDRIKSIARKDGFVWFYKTKENSTTACFGNFYEGSRKIFGCRTAEGAFQAKKFVGTPYHQFAGLDGEGAWRLARNIRCFCKKTTKII